MSSGPSFGKTLQFITSIKLQELEKQRLAYQAHAGVLKDAAAAPNDITRVEILAKGVQSWAGTGAIDGTKIIGGKLSLYNLNFWLKQARRDPNFDANIIKGWVQTLEAHIRHTTMRFDFARLFGNLFNEWVASGDSTTVAYQTSAAAEGSWKAEDYVELSRKEMYEQKEQLMSIVFEEGFVHTTILKMYLQELFSGEDETFALATLRNNLFDFGESLPQRKLDSGDVIRLIKGLLASNLMNEEKRATMKEFMDNATVLTEVASVLNMRLASLDTWSWPEEGLLVEMRRHLNGKYRAFTDPEILDGLLLQHLGISWQVKFKEEFLNLFDSKAWKRSPPLSHREKERRKQQLELYAYGGDTIDEQRNTMRRNNFFMTQLSDSVDSSMAYDDLVDTPENENASRMTPVAVKQKLLNIMATECYLNQAIHESHAVIRSDLAWFGPSLSHASIFTILEFFGISKQWLDFFQAFLSAPLYFQGDPADQVRVRKCGTPISHALSVVIGEVVLFCMDFAVNQRADGIFLHRMHDDLWIWDADPNKLAAAWREMNVYADLVGLKFNKTKTGAACIGRSEMRSLLPPGDIRWGFLKFDTNEARFMIDQEEVDLHIKELRRQLAATKSVFGWVNVYNKYMAFFLRNFGGQPARCFGTRHQSDIIDTFGRVQRELFPNTKQGPTDYLRAMIKDRFGMQGLPDGYFYFPISRGGLELRNPLLELFVLKGKLELEDITVYDGYLENVLESDTFKRQMQSDEISYKISKEAWGSDSLTTGQTMQRKLDGIEEFMSLEEYGLLRESTLRHWGMMYRNMLETPRPVPLTLTPAVRAAMEGSNSRRNSQDLTSTYRNVTNSQWAYQPPAGLYKCDCHLCTGKAILSPKPPPPQPLNKIPLISEPVAIKEPRAWSSLDWYEKWVVSLYGEEVVEKFGGLQVVDPTLIPIGMVQLFKTARVKLDQ